MAFQPFRPFGIGGRRRTGPSQVNPWANVSAAIALLTYLVALLLFNGVFLGGAANCGGFGLTCLAESVLALGAGGLLGTLVALASLAGTDKQRWLSRTALVLNGLPALGVLGLVLWFFA